MHHQDKRELGMSDNRRLSKKSKILILQHDHDIIEKQNLTSWNTPESVK
jgi:hypothetical protein